jgi:hypothetical protein
MDADRRGWGRCRSTRRRLAVGKRERRAGCLASFPSVVSRIRCSTKACCRAAISSAEGAGRVGVSTASALRCTAPFRRPKVSYCSSLIPHASQAAQGGDDQHLAGLHGE